MQDIIVILEEGNRPYPSCPKCDMFENTGPSTAGTLRLAFSARERNRRLGTKTTITAYGIPLASVSSLNYLGIVMLTLDDDWTAMVRNLRRARQK